jgi:Helix-turn-helix domain
MPRKYSVRPRPIVALTIKGVAEALSISRERVLEMIRDGLPVRRLTWTKHKGNRRILVRDLEAYIERRWPLEQPKERPHD